MNRLLQVFALAVLAILLLAACGPAAPSPVPPTQVAQVETQPTLARPTAVASTPTSAVPTKAGCPAPAGWSAYAVKSGDTLIALAKQVNRTVEELMQANCLTSPTIGVGSTLYLPLETCAITPPDDWNPYTVRSGDTLFSLASARGTTVEDVKRQNCLVSDMLDIGKQLYLPPAPPITPAPPAPAVSAPVVQPQAPVVSPSGGGEVKLPSEIFFHGGGGGMACFTPQGPLPAIEVLRLPIDRGLILCAYGFPTDEDLTVIVYTEHTVIGTDIVRLASDGRNVVAVQSGAQAGDVDDGNFFLNLWWPIDLPDTVYVQINTADKVARQTVHTAQLGPRTGFLPTIPYSPFPDRSLFSDFDKCLVVKPGTTLQFSGAGFMPGQQIPIGLYLYSGKYNSPSKLFESGQTTADGSGHFGFPIRVQPTDLPGRYYAVTATDPGDDKYSSYQQTDCYIIP